MKKKLKNLLGKADLKWVYDNRRGEYIYRLMLNGTCIGSACRGGFERHIARFPGHGEDYTDPRAELKAELFDEKPNKDSFVRLRLAPGCNQGCCAVRLVCESPRGECLPWSVQRDLPLTKVIEAAIRNSPNQKLYMVLNYMQEVPA